jgi:hypothetical protein
MQTRQYILYQAYGNVAIINECKYALLRLMDVYANSNKPQVIIYTDSYKDFEIFKNDIDIIFEQVDQQLIKHWRGAIDFVHRVKIEVIKDALTKYSGKVIYCDTDTYCLTPLDDMFKSVTPSNVFLHINEGELALPPTLHLRKWKKFLTVTSIPEFSSLSPLKTTMWNAGVIGLDESHLCYINEVLELTDKLYPMFNKHTVEQFAFCYTFQKNSVNISGAHSFIFHYWNLKEFRLLLQNMFEKYKEADIGQLVELSREVLPERIVADKLKFEKSRFITKFANWLAGKRWTINRYSN